VAACLNKKNSKQAKLRPVSLFARQRLYSMTGEKRPIKALGLRIRKITF
jgi:hypothetical protein